MNKLEFERKIKAFNIQKISYDAEMAKVFGKGRELYLDRNTCDLYGCFYEDEVKEFIIFFMDAERGIARDLGNYKTEKEAYENLFIRMKKWQERM